MIEMFQILTGKYDSEVSNFVRLSNQAPNKLRFEGTFPSNLACAPDFVGVLYAGYCLVLPGFK